MQRHSFTALNSTFVVDSEYQYVKELGQGAYGCVVAARHRRSGEGCAIKKITNINTKVRKDSIFLEIHSSLGAAYSDQAVLAGDQVCCMIRYGYETVRLSALLLKAVAPLQGPQKCIFIAQILRLWSI